MAISFAKQMESYRKKYEKRMVLLHKKVSTDLFRKPIEMTPVKEGRAKGNWTLGINNIPTEEIDVVDKYGSKTMTKVIAGLENLKLGDTSVLANSVPYIGKLEYGGYNDGPKTSGGFSIQAPQGMVRIAIEEFRPTLNKAIVLAKRETP